MLIYILLLIVDILFNLICYITNPIVILFADEYGELPAIFKWWANWDDGLDIEWMISEHHVPKWAEYDFNKHYKYYSEWEALKQKGRFKGYVELLDPNFTLKERFQRYICRLVWLYRNCAYGFSYYITGRVINGAEIIDKNPPLKILNQKVTVRYYKNWLTTGPFCIYGMIRWNPKNISWLKWTKIDHNFIMKIFFGWKFQSTKSNITERAMLAFFWWPFK